MVTSILGTKSSRDCYGGFLDTRAASCRAHVSPDLPSGFSTHLKFYSTSSPFTFASGTVTMRLLA